MTNIDVTRREDESDADYLERLLKLAGDKSVRPPNVMHLDPKALEAAINWHNRHVGDGMTDTEKGVLVGFTTAYLLASVPAEIGELVECLEQQSRLGPLNVARAAMQKAATALRVLSVRNRELERQSEADKNAARCIMPYLRWTISNESPGHHPTMPSAVAAFAVAFGWPTQEAWEADLRASVSLVALSKGVVAEARGEADKEFEHLAIAERMRRAERGLTHPAPTHNDGSGEITASDPRTIIAGIKQFGLAADGSDLRDLEAALSHTSGEVTEAWPDKAKFQLGDRVTKIKGSSWTGRICGIYSTSLNPIGYAVESENEPGSVQIYPEAALRREVS